MPYHYELQNRQHFRHAVLTGVALAFLLLLLALAPAKILAWSGVAFGSLTVPEQAPAEEQLSVGRPAVVQIQTPPAIEPFTFPAYAEWSDIEISDIEISCADCDLTLSYGVGGALDAVDNESLDGLERSSQLGASTLGASHYRSGSSSAPTGLGGGGAAEAGSPESSDEASDSAGEAVAQTDGADGAEESASVEAVHTAETRSASAAGAGGGSSASGSSDNGSSDSGSSDSGSSDSGSTASDVLAAGNGSAGGSASDAETTLLEETNLVLSPISPVADEGSGGASPAINTAPQEVVHALAAAPVGAETVHTLGEPDAIEALLDLEVAAVSSDSGAGEQQQTVPEPASLMLMGLALTAVLYQLRRAVRA